MSVAARHDVHEGDGVVVLVELVGGNLAAQDLGEDVAVVIGGSGHVGLDPIGSAPVYQGEGGAATWLRLADRHTHRPALAFAERRALEIFADPRHLAALAHEIVGDGAAQAGMRRCNAPNAW